MITVYSKPEGILVNLAFGTRTILTEAKVVETGLPLIRLRGLTMPSPIGMRKFADWESLLTGDEIILTFSSLESIITLEKALAIARESLELIQAEEDRITQAIEGGKLKC